VSGDTKGRYHGCRGEMLDALSGAQHNRLARNSPAAVHRDLGAS
jgi:hypothetical protein